MDAPLLYRTWKRFVREGILDSNRLEKVVLDSWLRSRNYGVNPLRERGQVVLTPEELGTRRRKYQVAIKEIESFVHKIRDAISTHRMIVLFADPEGFILTQSGHPDTLRQAAHIEFVPGADWSERAVGTNAIGTALATQSAVYVEGYQHYVVATHPWCCAAVPLRGRDGSLLGVLNVSGPVEAAHPYLLSVVATMGIHIEQQIQRVQQVDLFDSPNERAFEGVAGQSESFRNTLYLAEKASKVDYPVCLFGESGTGKELLARYIHRLSSRRNGPFVALNCGSVSAQLLESELFAKGNFAKTCFTGFTFCLFAFRRCAKERKTSLPWSSIFFRNAAWAKRSPRRDSGCFWPMIGLGILGNCEMFSSLQQSFTTAVKLAPMFWLHCWMRHGRRRNRCRG